VVIPSDRPALGQSVASISTLLTDKTTPGYDNITPRGSAPPKFCKPDGRAYDPNHHGMEITTWSQLSRSDQIQSPRPGHERPGQQGRDPKSRQPTMGQLPVQETSRLLPRETERQDGSHDSSKQAIPGRGVGEQPPLPLRRYGRNSTVIVRHAFWSTLAFMNTYHRSLALDVGLRLEPV
jgi:hypothetical protein